MFSFDILLKRKVNKMGGNYSTDGDEEKCEICGKAPCEIYSGRDIETDSSSDSYETHFGNWPD